MLIIKKLITLLTLCLLPLGFSAFAAEEKKDPSGTVTFNEMQWGLIIGGSAGEGVLNFKGREFRFKISALTVGANVGISKTSTHGEVFDLNNLLDFAGTYNKFEGNLTLAGGGGGTLMKNEHGVIMKLTTFSEGLQINLSAGDVKVEFIP